MICRVLTDYIVILPVDADDESMQEAIEIIVNTMNQNLKEETY